MKIGMLLVRTPLELGGKLLQICKSSHLLLLPVWALYSVVTKLLTGKALDFAHVTLLLLSTLLLVPLLGTFPVDLLLLALCNKGNCVLLPTTMSTRGN